MYINTFVLFYKILHKFQKISSKKNLILYKYQFKLLGNKVQYAILLNSFVEYK